MKRKLKAVLLFGSLLGIGLNVPVSAVESKKEKPVVARKSALPEGKAAGKPAGKGPHQHTPLAKKTAHQPLKQTSGRHKVVADATKAHHSAVETRPSLRKLSAADLDPKRLGLYSVSALVVDQTTGQAVLEKRPDNVVPIASISKLMTAMVVLDAHLDLNEVITIGDEDVDGLKKTHSRLPVGTTMTRETAMLLALMSSENRAAHALGRHYPGGLHAFVAAMNRKAQMLGMVNSSFEEPTGLSRNNVSTAHDLARMVAAASRYQEIRNFSTTAEAKVELNGRLRDFGNTNALVRSDRWEIGLSKTGFIKEAGRCLVMQARVADKPVVIVLLDSVGKMTRVGDANRIKRWMESASLLTDRKPV